MRDLLAKCGNNCGRCALYKDNLTDEKRQGCADGMAWYIGWKPDPLRLRQCAGCQATDGFLYLKNCAVRQCAQYNGIENCAYCAVFPCQYVPTVSVSVDYRDRVAERLGNPIPEDDYLAFIEPYEGMKHLEAMRATLSREDLVEPSKVRPLRTRVAKLPDDLPVSGDKEAAYRALHGLMADMLTGRGDLRVQQVMMQKRRKELLNLFWVFGRHGELDEKGTWLVIDGRIHGSRKDFANIVRKRDNTLHTSTAEGVELLRNFGVRVEHAPLTKKTWRLRLSLDDGAGGVAAMRALQGYVGSLIDGFGEPEYAGSSRYKGEAFARFCRADMGGIHTSMR
jgi:hypothetical protein